MENPIMEYFKYDHLPENLKQVSRPFGHLAKRIDDTIPNCVEKNAGLRKLLEAKDCIVRASLEKE